MELIHMKLFKEAADTKATVLLKLMATKLYKLTVIMLSLVLLMLSQYQSSLKPTNHSSHNIQEVLLVHNAVSILTMLFS